MDSGLFIKSGLCQFIAVVRPRLIHAGFVLLQISRLYADLLDPLSSFLPPPDLFSTMLALCLRNPPSNEGTE